MRLQRYLEEASSLLSSAVEEKTVTEDKLQVEKVITRINTSISFLEHCNCDWANLLKDLKSEEKGKQEKE